MHARVAHTVEAIKSVAVGKKGSRSLSDIQVQGLIQELSHAQVDPVKRAALATALCFKGVSEEETPLLEHLFSGERAHASTLINLFIPDVSPHVKELIAKILDGYELNAHEAGALGDFYFDIHRFHSEQDDIARTISCVWLRLRYASHDEYFGLQLSLAKTVKEAFSRRMPVEDHLIQLSEPFDGVEKCPLITPLIARSLVKNGYGVVALTGESSGPKYGVTLKDVARGLKAPFLSSNLERRLCREEFGAYIDTASLSDSWSYWRGLRERFIKRPFMATLEKFFHVMGASVSITSAFHEPFLEKMLILGENAGFKGNIVIRKGREGSLAFSLSKPVIIHCSARRSSGDFIRHSFEYSLADLNKEELPDGREPVSLDQNIRLIRNYLAGSFAHEGAHQKIKGSELNEEEKFCLRVQLTVSGLKKAMDWVTRNMSKDGVHEL